MSGELNRVKSNSTSIMTAIRGVIPDTWFGVVSHKDYPGNYSGYGYPAGGRGDLPESYTRILYESYAAPDIQWREGAKRILLFWHLPRVPYET